MTNIYRAFYQNTSIIVDADTLYDAQQKAQAAFGVVGLTGVRLMQLKPKKVRAKQKKTAKNTVQWFQLKPEDEIILKTLYDKYGVGTVIAVLSRWQHPVDTAAKGDAVLREAGLL